MTTEEFENIIKEQGELKNLPNSRLIEMMDKLSIDSSDENEVDSETFVLSDYSIKETDEISNSNSNSKSKSISKCNSEYIILNNYSIKDI